jgi:hypothetical protein
MGRAGPRKVHCDSLEFKRQAVKLSDLDGVEVQAVHFLSPILGRGAEVSFVGVSRALHEPIPR